jgi:hypothetical protein
MDISIFAIDRDHGSGRYERRHAYGPLPAACVSHPSGRPGLADYQDTDGGLVATVAAPEGSRLERSVLVLPDGTRLDADEALRAARSKPWLSFGLRIVAD